MTWIDLRIGISMAERGVLGGVLMVIECWVGTHLLTTLLQLSCVPTSCFSEKQVQHHIL